MFNFFSKRKEKDLSEAGLRKQAVKEMKKIRKAIRKSGGAERVCYDYWKFIEKDEIFQDLGVVIEENAPYKKMVATVSALDMLNSWKNMPDFDEKIDDYKSIKSIAELMPEKVYIASLNSASSEELGELYENVVGGKLGRITNTDEENDKKVLELREIFLEKNKEVKIAWDKWKEAEAYDVLDAIRMA
jgi:hypothetical protein